MVGTWWTDTTFSHGLLILPLAAFLVYHGRQELKQVSFQWSWVGLLLMGLLACLWLFGHIVQVRLVEQVAVVTILQAILLATLGPEFIRRFLFPVAFLWFAVPFGKELVPPLMEATADLSLLFLRISGIPVYRDGMLLYIPEGTYEVARACSGIKFLTAMVALSSFYAYLMYDGWRKRITFVVIGVVLAIVMNGFRAYLLILIGHLSDMRFDHDGWHVRVGQILFVIVLFAFFKIGARYRDDLKETPPTDGSESKVGSSGTKAQGMLVTVLGLAMLGLPAIAGNRASSIAPDIDQLQAASPRLAAAPGWQPLSVASIKWRPSFVGGIEPIEFAAEGDGGRVDVMVRIYPLPGAGSDEMVTFRNRIQPDSDERLYPERMRRVVIEGVGDVALRETTVQGAGDRLVWYWYDVDGELAATPRQAKIAEAKSLFTKGPGAQRVVVISTAPVGEQSAELLQKYLTDHADQLLPDAPGI